MDNKVTFLINIFVRAIMGEGERTDCTIKEALKDDYIRDKIRVSLSVMDEDLITETVAALMGNGNICEALNHISGSMEEKKTIIIQNVWEQLHQEIKRVNLQ